MQNLLDYQPLFKTLKDKGLGAIDLLHLGAPDKAYNLVANNITNTMDLYTIAELCRLLECEIQDIVMYAGIDLPLDRAILS